ncbi:Cof-type HAD-IIB family hydrolase [Halalkalibacterium ligniniphilum]|uniref:Cof-type HAD-IIB family hydrolase n=1 Tax=Halalkalibacterium ligniniphilum TaxID=1134413 RepID=UPI0003483DFD|nr:Cof-type HAD-IIB family hydrolase [Halalkalibacterium ligniniphilum]
MKIFATDMDGTLLNDERRVTKENAIAIKEAQEAGVMVVVVTGRDYSEAQKPLEDAGIHCPIICVNGAEERDEKGKVIRSVPILKKDALFISDVLREHDIYFELYTNEGAFTDHHEKALQVVIDVLQSSGSEDSIEKMRAIAEERFITAAVTEVASYEHILQDERQQVYKFLAFSLNDEKRDKAKQILSETDRFAVSSSASENLEITNKHAQKGIALTNFAERLGVDMKDVVVIGDNLNDLSMFEVAGHAIAMDNAVEEIKSKAHSLTSSNEESGVAEALNEYLKRLV